MTDADLSPVRVNLHALEFALIASLNHQLPTVPTSILLDAGDALPSACKKTSA